MKMRLWLAFCCCIAALVLPTKTLAQPDETWLPMGHEKVGTWDDRGTGEQVMFSSSSVMMEAHGMEGPPKDKGWISPVGMKISVYLFEKALFDWVPLGEALHHKYDDGYDSVIAKAAIQPAGGSYRGNALHNVALLESYLAFDPQDNEKIVKCHARIVMYENYAGTWFDNGVLDTPEDMRDCDSFNWGADMALSKNNTLAVGIPSVGGGSIQLYTMNEDPFLTNTWEPLGKPLVGDIPMFGFVVKMSHDSSVVLGQGCKETGSDDDYDFDCFFRAFRYSESTSSWSQMGTDIQASDLKLMPGDAVALDLETGLTLVVGSRDVTPWCPESKMGGHVRVYEYSEHEKDWTQKGKDLDSLMDFKGTKDATFGTSLSIGNNGKRVAVGAYWTDKTAGQISFVQMFNYNNYQWELDGSPINTGAFAVTEFSPGEADKLVVGAKYGTFYLGNLQTLSRNDRSELYSGHKETEFHRMRKQRKEKYSTRSSSHLGTKTRRSFFDHDKRLRGNNLTSK